MPEKPNMVNVSSRNLAAMGHNEEGLFVEFQGGGVYHYPDVTEEQYQEGLRAGSVGSWFHRNIRNSYAYKKL